MPSFINFTDVIVGGVLVVDSELNVLFWNEWLSVVTGIKQEDVINKKINVVLEIDKWKLESLRRNIKIALAMNSVTFMTPDMYGYLFEVPMKSHILTSFEFMQQEIKIAPLDDECSQIGLFITDCTAVMDSQKYILFEQESMKNLAEHLGDMFDNMKSAVSIYHSVDKGNSFVFTALNKAAEKVDNLSRELVLGNDVAIVFPDTRNIGLLDVLKRVWHSGNAEEFLLDFHSGNTIPAWRDGYAYKLPNGEIVTIYQDVTEKKQAEDELHMLNRSLEAKVAFEKSKRLEQESILIHQSKMATMGEMITMIAHQWRQPLNALAISVQTAELVHSQDKLDDKYMTSFRANSMAIIQKMSKTIHDFREFFKTNKEKKRLSVEDAIRQTLYIMNPVLQSEGIKLTLKFNAKHYAYGFKSELEQALLILISNAKEAIMELGSKKPHIIIRTTEINSDKVLISVDDNGGGVPSELVDKIFEPYFTTKDDKNGTGIGLYMAKEIVEQHMNGKIYVKRIPMGSSFRIELPKY